MGFLYNARTTVVLYYEIGSFSLFKMQFYSFVLGEAAVYMYEVVMPSQFAAG